MVRNADDYWRILKAERFLAAADRAIAAGDVEAAVSRAYYAAYHAVIAVLEAKAGVRQRNRWDHTQVEVAFRERFTNRGYQFTRQQADELRELLNWRLVADYERQQIRPDRAMRYVGTARALVAAITKVMNNA